jgi:single-strand DNA-binding protein
MNALTNKVQLIGRLGAKAEIKSTASGKVFTRVSLATHESFKNTKGEKVQQTTWHNLVAWGKTAEVIQKYTDKGTEIAVEGKLVNREYVGKDGVKRQVTEILVNEVLLRGDKTSAFIAEEQRKYQRPSL